MNKDKEIRIPIYIAMHISPCFVCWLFCMVGWGYWSYVPSLLTMILFAHYLERDVAKVTK